MNSLYPALYAILNQGTNNLGSYVPQMNSMVMWGASSTANLSLYQGNANNTITQSVN